MLREDREDSIESLNLWLNQGDRQEVRERKDRIINLTLSFGAGNLTL